jgi:hypothetical protein
MIYILYYYLGVLIIYLGKVTFGVVYEKIFLVVNIVEIRLVIYEVIG